MPPNVSKIGIYTKGGELLCFLTLLAAVYILYTQWVNMTL